MMLRFPTAVARDPKVDAWLGGQSGELGELARELFERMRTCGDDVRELVHDGQATVCVGDAPFGYVDVFKAHVNVGFFHGKLRPGRVPEGLAALIDVAYRDIKTRLG
jgi:hypothetical protein